MRFVIQTNRMIVIGRFVIIALCHVSSVKVCMATLRINEYGELCVTLRGATEDRVLTTLRGWLHWLRADVERDLQNPARCVAVTLITDREHEATVREILKRGFGLIFPVEGGSDEVPPAPVVQLRRRK
jgi:hypothetical protein